MALRTTVPLPLQWLKSVVESIRDKSTGFRHPQKYSQIATSNANTEPSPMRSLVCQYS